MTGRAYKWLLFIFWPLIACVLLFFCAMACVAAWCVIPFGEGIRENESWSIKFPWSKT